MTTSNNNADASTTSTTVPAASGINSSNEFVARCPDCGQEVGRWDLTYIKECPHGSDLAMEQAMDRHHSVECPYSDRYDHVAICPDCGEEIGRWDIEYWVNNPCGAGLAEEQAWENHWCPVEQARIWEAWRLGARAHEDETPRELVKRRISEGQRLALYKIPSPPDREHQGDWVEEIKELLKEFLGA